MFLDNYKLKLSKKVSREITRIRIAPRIYDYCFFTAKNNLKLLKTSIEFARKSQINLKTLDIGCGSKPFLDLFHNKDEYIGVDFSEDSKANIIHDLNKNLPFNDNYFDLIIFSETLEHLEKPYKILEDCERVLKDKGILFLSTPFCLNIHGGPNDFFRFTEYFYKNLIPKKLNLECLKINLSNNIFSTPLLILPHIILVLPFIPDFIKKILNLLINTFVYLIEKCFYPFLKIEFTKNFLNSLPIGYSVIFRKKIH